MSFIANYLTYFELDLVVNSPFPLQSLNHYSINVLNKDIFHDRSNIYNSWFKLTGITEFEYGYKAIVKRDVVRVITPGTLTEDSLLEANENNFLGSLSEIRESISLAWIDISTGDFIVTSCSKTNLKALILRLNLRELLVSEDRIDKFSDDLKNLSLIHI